MEKKLHISAIIPDELYVYREADRKLEEAILRMSKPAYISVSRQMGKTNLLIHAKRKLENDNNRYAFIDITNKFDSAQDCFRYIVDQIIDGNEQIRDIAAAGEIIKKNRGPQTSNPTQEYQDELREILKKYKGNIVIFLDEVDDLRKHEFSDDIFAQIRKTYFLRVTYPVFNRLSYVLCGVIDPEKLIKNKDNSPFNIAIPIYLDDFNVEEFSQFISKSGLPITEEIKTHIFRWLKGNPRMTFDVLSQLEDELINGKAITYELVDNIIYEIYLTNFKHPPIDHIRDLVKHNTEVRKGVIALKQKRFNDISESTKNKLYLFGIISSRVNKEDIFIKNDVIDLCLSNQWLQEIELEKKGYYELGLEKMADQQYSDAIVFFLEYIQNNPKNDLTLTRYQIGVANFFLQNYEVSNQYLLSKPIKREKFPDLYFRQANCIGVNYSKTGDYENAILYFEEIIESAQNPAQIVAAIVNKGEVLFTMENIDLAVIKDLYLGAISYLEEDIEDKKPFATIIYYRLGTLEDDTTLALRYFRQALSFATPAEMPLIYLGIDTYYTEDTEYRKSIYLDIVNVIVNNKVLFSDNSGVIPFNESHLLLCLLNLFGFNCEHEYESLLTYSLNFIYKGSIKEYQLFYRLADFAYINNQIDISLYYFEKISIDSQLDLKTKLVTFRTIGLILNGKKQIDESIIYIKKYSSIFIDNNNFGENIVFYDCAAFVHLILHYVKEKNGQKTISYVGEIEKYFKVELPPGIQGQMVYMWYFAMDYCSSAKMYRKAIEYANKILHTVAYVKPLIKDISFIDEESFLLIENLATRVISSAGENNKTPFSKKTVNIRRNDLVEVRYKDGRKLFLKYKKALKDIESGDCVIL